MIQGNRAAQKQATTLVSDSRPTPEAPPGVIGDWVIERALGAGAMGEVFLAKRDRQQAALKVVAKKFAGDDDFIQRFQREIAVLARLDHPAVARALSWGQLDGRPWLAMEFIPGRTLESLLNECGHFLEAEVLALGIQVARGLEHIHQRAGLIHRDVKPANIIISRAAGGDPARLLNPGDQAKLIDFGLAKAVENPEDQGLTMTGMIMGTPNYISPEQVACERTLTLHVDMYALGATMFHLLTGQVPFKAGSAAATMAAHLNQPVPDPGAIVPGLSAATRALVRTTLAKTAAARFADWSAFVHAAEQALAAIAGSEAFQRKPPARSPATTATVRSGEPSRAPSGPHARPASAPHSALGGAVALEARPGSAEAVVAALAAGRPGEGSAALRAAVTSRIGKVQTSSTYRKPVASAPHHSGKTSAVHKWSGRLETAGSTGGAILPWIALGIGILAVLAGVAWAVLGR